MEDILMISGCYTIIVSLLVNTHDFLSSVLLKGFLFFAGVLTCLCAMQMYGLVSIF